MGRIILVDDFSDRVELEAQLMQAEKLSSIGLLAAGVAHEVNTPLAVISSYAQMLAKQVRGDERLGPLLDKITQQTFRASEIVNGLLNFSRTSGTEFRELDLNQMIRRHAYACLTISSRPREFSWRSNWNRTYPAFWETPASFSRSFSICF